MSTSEGNIVQGGYNDIPSFQLPHVNFPITKHYWEKIESANKRHKFSIKYNISDFVDRNLIFDFGLISEQFEFEMKYVTSVKRILRVGT